MFNVLKNYAMLQNVCRLCSCTQDLVWAFNEKISYNMKEIIKVTCGVEVRTWEFIILLILKDSEVAGDTNRAGYVGRVGTGSGRSV
mgnify:CR=1 FL=1